MNFDASIAPIVIFDCLSCVWDFFCLFIELMLGVARITLLPLQSRIVYKIEIVSKMRKPWPRETNPKSGVSWLPNWQHPDPLTEKARS